ncbi:MAG: 6-bladed beta-propeller [Bacteroidota bacterium]
MKKTIIVIIIFLTACIQKKDKSNIINLGQTDQIEIDLDSEKITNLKNSPRIVGEISSIDMIHDSALVISTAEPPNVIIFNKKGNQIKKIDKYGKGANEYLKPNIVRHYQNHVYIYCGDQNRLIKFNLNGEPEKQYNIKKRIKDFEIYKDYACLYTTGSIDNSIISIFDLSQEKILKQKYGKPSKEHKILNMKENTGAIAIDDSLLYFSLVSKPKITLVNLSTLKKLKEFHIKDPEFTTKKVSTDINSFLRKRDQSIQYMFGSDVVTEIFTSDSNIIVKSEIGELKMDGFKFKDASERKIKLYIFDKNMNFQAIHLQKAENVTHQIHASSKSKIYSVRLTKNLENYIWERLSWD